jgi:hypothetical protein
MWADKADYKPTDDDYINASPFSVAYLANKLSSTWGEIKSSY